MRFVTSPMCFLTLRNLFVIASVIKFTSQREHMLQRRSFASSSLSTSVLEGAVIPKEPSSSLSKVPACPISTRFGQPIDQAGLSKQAEIRLLYQSLREYRAASKTSKACPRDSKRELCMSYNDEEHSETPNKKLRLPEVSSGDGSSTSAKAVVQDKGTPEAHQYVQHSIEQGSSALAGMPIEQKEITMANNLGRSPTNMNELPGEKELPVIQGSYAAFYHPEILLDPQVGYGIDYLQLQNRPRQPSKTPLPYQGVVKQSEMASNPYEASPSHYLERDFILCHDKVHYAAPSKKSPMHEVPTAERSCGSANHAQDEGTLGAQSYVQRSIPQGLSTTLKVIPTQEKEIIMASDKGRIAPNIKEHLCVKELGRLPSNVKENLCKKELPVNLDLSLSFQPPENLLDVRVDGGIDYDQTHRPLRNMEVPMPSNQVFPESEFCRDSREIKSYPSRILAWDLGQINPKVAHGAEIFAQELAKRLPSVFSSTSLQIQNQMANPSKEERPNKILLPLTYELLMKGITRKHWTKVKQFSGDFWENWSNSETQRTDVPVPLFLWFCEFTLEATVPQFFSKGGNSESGAKPKAISRNVFPHYSVWVSKLIRYLSIGDHQKYKPNTKPRILAVKQLYQLATTECSGIENLEQFQNFPEIHRYLFEKLSLKSEQIKSAGSCFWAAYQTFHETATLRWKQRIKNNSSILSCCNDAKWKEMIMMYPPEFHGELMMNLENSVSIKSYPLAARLKYVPLNPDELLRLFIVTEMTRIETENKGFQRFLPGRIHDFFEGIDKYEKRDEISCGNKFGLP